MYGETIAGVTVSCAYRSHRTFTKYIAKIVRAFGASTKFLRDMQRHVDTVCVARLLESCILGLIACFSERYFVPYSLPCMNGIFYCLT
jgi:hypothetical protein